MTKPRETVIRNVKFATIDRLNCSRNGNPRFQLVLITPTGEYVGVYRTQSDASCNYAVTNFARETVDVWLSGRGTICDIRKSEEGER